MHTAQLRLAALDGHWQIDTRIKCDFPSIYIVLKIYLDLKQCCKD